jgi:hypothetical protein
MMEEGFVLVPRIPLVVNEAVTRGGLPGLIEYLALERLHMNFAVKQETLEVTFDLLFKRLYHTSNFVKVQVTLRNSDRI